MNIQWRNRFLYKIELIHRNLIPIWPNGRRVDSIPGSGGNWTLKGYNRPVSVDLIEAFFLYNLAYSFGVKTAVEIGTGFGYSALWIAAGASEYHDRNIWLSTIDSLEEGGLGRKGYDFGLWAAKKVGLENQINSRIGKSPEDMNEMLKDHLIDMVFIDGNHNDGQPYRDFLGVRPFLNEKSIIVWHDYDERFTVPKDVMKCIDHGFTFHAYKTSCGIAVSASGQKRLEIADIAFEAAKFKQFVQQ